MDGSGVRLDSAERRLRPGLLGLAIAFLSMMLMLATEPSLAIGWDEGFNLGHEERVRDWFRALWDPPRFARTWQPPNLMEELVEPDPLRPPRPEDCDSREKLMSSRVIEWFWAFAREQPHGHPPFYAWVGLLGDLVRPGGSVLSKARFGTMLAFSITIGALFTAFARRRGLWAGIASAGAFALQPRLFGHGHFAHYDGLLTCLWVGAILTFSRAVEPDLDGTLRRSPRWLWVIGFGMLCGAAAATKLTGWFVPIPFIVWTLLYRDRRGFLALLAGGVVGVLVLYALVPPFWHDPVAGVYRFLYANLTRARTTRIPTLFLGEIIYTPKDSLPWYNTLVWTVLITPVGFLILSLVGLIWAIGHARSQRLGMLFVAHWLFLLVLRALPHTPGHDGERQFLAGFGCLSLVAGLGGAWLADTLGRWGRAVVAGSLVEGLVAIALVMPIPLSYYSPLVGGAPGASKLGMEPTYYWDALTDEALAWLRAHTGPNEKILFPSSPSIWRYLVRTNKLPQGALFQVPGRPVWYVLQNRPGAFEAVDRDLVARVGPRHVLVEKQGVPLIWAFPYAEFEASQAHVSRGSK